MVDAETNSYEVLPLKDGKFITAAFMQSIMVAGKEALALQNANLQATEKSSKEDLVTKGDLAVSQLLQQQIHQEHPEALIVDEEVATSHDVDWQRSGVTFVVDPIDGTTNYFNSASEEDPAKRNPNWAISVGVVEDGEIIAGAIYQPQANRLVIGEKGKGVFVNGKRVDPATFAKSDKLRLIFSPPYPKDKTAFDANTHAIERISALPNVDVQTLGSQVVELSKVVEGEADVFQMFETKPWDMAANIAFAKELGLKVRTATDDAEYPLFGRTITVYHPGIDLANITPINREELAKAV